MRFIYPILKLQNVQRGINFELRGNISADSTLLVTLYWSHNPSDRVLLPDS